MLRCGSECRKAVEKTRRKPRPQSFSITNAWVELKLCCTVNVGEFSVVVDAKEVSDQANNSHPR